MLVVVGGFQPHYMMSAAVQSIAQQLPKADIMMLYASRDVPPDYQDKNLVHVQGWTADAENNYVIRAGGPGYGGPSRCHSPESRARGVESDPSLVKVSFFTRKITRVHMTGALISPAASVQAVLLSSKHVLFCGEGDAALARSCLEIPAWPIPSFVARPNRFFPDGPDVDSYDSHMRSAKNNTILTPDQAAQMWAEAWPTDMPQGPYEDESEGMARRLSSWTRNQRWAEQTDDDGTEAPELTQTPGWSDGSVTVAPAPTQPPSCSNEEPVISANSAEVATELHSNTEELLTVMKQEETDDQAANPTQTHVVKQEDTSDQAASSSQTTSKASGGRSEFISDYLKGVGGPASYSASAAIPSRHTLCLQSFWGSRRMSSVQPRRISLLPHL